jgi:hypothetical protein
MLIVAHNIDIACSVIEKATKEHTVIDVDDAFILAYNDRHMHCCWRDKSLLCTNPIQGQFSIKQVQSYVNPRPNSHVLHSFENNLVSHMSNSHISVPFLCFHMSQFIVYLWHFNRPLQIVFVYAQLKFN